MGDSRIQGVEGLIVNVIQKNLVFMNRNELSGLKEVVREALTHITAVEGMHLLENINFDPEALKGMDDGSDLADLLLYCKIDEFNYVNLFS